MINRIETSWTKEQVQDLIKREKLAYQKIDLPYGLSTGGKDRSATSAAVFADEVKGKSVLDVGCFLGYFCHEAVRRGASRVVGIDVDENRLRQAGLVADCLGMDIEFRLLDIEQDKLTEQFDVTLMLNVLHHFRNPITVIDKVIAHTRERIILEVASPSSARPGKLLKSMGASWWARRRLDRLPLIVVGRDWAVNRGNEQKYFFTPSALTHLLMEQRGSFSRLELKTSGFKKRYIGVAWKRHVGYLLIIGGTTSSGKSTLISRLKQGKLPEVAEAIDMDARDNWIYTDAVRIRNIETENIQKAVYHYDLLRTFKSDTYTYSREQGIDVLDCADKRSAVTIWCDPDVMCQRQQTKLRKGMRHWRERRVKDVLALYKDGRQLAQQYRKWIAYCRQKHVQLFFVDCTDEPRLLTESEWDKKVKSLERA